MVEFRNNSVDLGLGDIMNVNQALAGNQPVQAQDGNQNADNQNDGNQNDGNQNADNQNAGNQNPGNQNTGNQNPGNQNAGNQNSRTCKPECWLTALYIVLLVAVLVGVAIFFNEVNCEWKKQNDPKIFVKFDVPHDLWKTLISVKDDPTNIETESDENFQKIWVSYFKAKSYVADYRGELTTDMVEDFSQFSTQMEKETQKIVGLYKKYMRIMQEAYFKRFIKVFQLRPEDLDTIPCLDPHCDFSKITLGSG